MTKSYFYNKNKTWRAESLSFHQLRTTNLQCAAWKPSSSRPRNRCMLRVVELQCRETEMTVSKTKAWQSANSQEQYGSEKTKSLFQALDLKKERERAMLRDDWEKTKQRHNNSNEANSCGSRFTTKTHKKLYQCVEWNLDSMFYMDLMCVAWGAVSITSHFADNKRIRARLSFCALVSGVG